MKNKFVKGLLAFLAVTASIAAAIAIMLKVLKKFFNISVEFSPKYENEECDCGECEECCEDAAAEAEEGVEFELSEDENTDGEVVNA